jgi:hypothetical protein
MLAWGFINKAVGCLLRRFALCVSRLGRGFSFELVAFWTARFGRGTQSIVGGHMCRLRSHEGPSQTTDRGISSAAVATQDAHGCTWVDAITAVGAGLRVCVCVWV